MSSLMFLFLSQRAFKEAQIKCKNARLKLDFETNGPQAVASIIYFSFEIIKKEAFVPFKVVSKAGHLAALAC